MQVYVTEEAKQETETQLKDETSDQAESAIPIECEETALIDRQFANIKLLLGESQT